MIRHKTGRTGQVGIKAEKLTQAVGNLLGLSMLSSFEKYAFCIRRLEIEYIQK